MSLCNREASVVRLSVCLSVCLSVNFYTQVATSTTNMTRSPPNLHTMVHMDLHPGCAQGQGQDQRSRDTGTSVMSRSVCYTVPSDVLSLHALTLRSTVTLSFQYKCQTDTCNVYNMQWATPSLTVWFRSKIKTHKTSIELIVTTMLMMQWLGCENYIYII